jgi:hypothetical protein
VRAVAATAKHAFVSISAKMTVGFDLKFLTDTVVIIGCSYLPYREEIRQMIANGNRTLSNYEGYFFYTGSYIIEGDNFKLLTSEKELSSRTANF